MSKNLKCTVGDTRHGYKTIELTVAGNAVTYKILRNRLAPVDKIQSVVTVSDEWLARFDALNIFAWEKIYSSDKHGGSQWELIFKDGKQIYCGHGANSYPDAWEKLLDLLDELSPVLGFIDAKRIDSLTMKYSRERILLETLTANRSAQTLSLKKISSAHTYNLSAEDTQKFFNLCQNFFGDVNVGMASPNCSEKICVKLIRHDCSEIELAADFNESGLPGVTDFVAAIFDFMPDLTVEMSAPAAQIHSPDGKFILCKVQFKGSYKPYTYRTDDETLAVGDVVDVFVGKNNDVAQARLVEIGYFDEYEVPYPLDKIKSIIGKNVAVKWDEF